MKKLIVGLFVFLLSSSVFATTESIPIKLRVIKPIAIEFDRAELDFGDLTEVPDGGPMTWITRSTGATVTGEPNSSVSSEFTISGPNASMFAVSSVAGSDTINNAGEMALTIGVRAIMGPGILAGDYEADLNVTVVYN